MYDYKYDCGCTRDGCLYRGDMYDICRARLGTPRGCGCDRIKCIVLGAVLMGVCILLVSCCIC